MNGAPDGMGDIVVFADGIIVGQMARVYVAYVSKHPEQENQSAAVVLVNAMTEANLVTVVKDRKPVVSDN
jgi:hypothetical protein